MNSNELKAARIRRGINSQEMAQKLNWSASKYSLKENGTRPLFIEEAEQITNILNLAPQEILNIFFNVKIDQNRK